MKRLNCLVILVLLAVSPISCGNVPSRNFPSEIPTERCTLTEAPPEVEAVDADYAKPGEPGCGEQFEVCLTRKTAKHYLQLLNYTEEAWAKCRGK